MLRLTLAAIFVLLLGLTLDRCGVPMPLDGRPKPSALTFTKAHHSGAMISYSWTRGRHESPQEFTDRVLADWSSLILSMDASE